MPPWRYHWPGLALLSLLSGCALRSAQPVPPPSPCALGPETVAWGLSGGQGLLIGACLGCLPALMALLWLGGQRRLRWLAKSRLRSSPLVLLLRLRFLRRELHKLMAQGRRQAQVVKLGPRRRGGQPPPPGRGQGGL